MVATVCLRLAFGMIAAILVVDPGPIPPRFFRIQYLASLGLLAVAAFFLFEQLVQPGLLLLLFMLAGVLCLVGSIAWHIENAGSRTLDVATAVALGVALAMLGPITSTLTEKIIRYGDQFLSAAVIGTSVAAMLLGHSYLISPAMTIVPLQRMLIGLWVTLALRVTLACWGLWFWTAEHPIGNLEAETLLWLIARWALGILAPLMLGWMAWETARIRSTQSATGILYVVVIVTFLGELTSLLLLEKTGYPL